MYHTIISIKESLLTLHAYSTFYPPLDVARSLNFEGYTYVRKVPSDIKGFMTGSRVYGTPRPDSDYDMVVLVSPEEEAQLKQRSDVKGKILYGNLNLITCTNELDFAAWYEGTRRLEEIKPVTRAFAIEVFESLALYRAMDGVTYEQMQSVPQAAPSTSLKVAPGAKWGPVSTVTSTSTKYVVMNQTFDKLLVDQLMKPQKYNTYFDQKEAWKKEKKVHFQKYNFTKYKNALKGGI